MFLFSTLNIMFDSLERLRHDCCTGMQKSFEQFLGIHYATAHDKRHLWQTNKLKNHVCSFVKVGHEQDSERGRVFLEPFFYHGRKGYSSISRPCTIPGVSKTAPHDGLQEVPFQSRKQVSTYVCCGAGEPAPDAHHAAIALLAATPLTTWPAHPSEWKTMQ